MGVLWGPQRTPLVILRVKWILVFEGRVMSLAVFSSAPHWGCLVSISNESIRDFCWTKLHLDRFFFRVIRYSTVSFIPTSHWIYVNLHVVLTRGTKWRISYLAPVHAEQVVFQAKVVEKIKTHILYVEIKCQLDATDDFYCRSYCLLNMFRAPLCP